MVVSTQAWTRRTWMIPRQPLAPSRGRSSAGHSWLLRSGFKNGPEDIWIKFDHDLKKPKPSETHRCWLINVNDVNYPKLAEVFRLVKYYNLPREMQWPSGHVTKGRWSCNVQRNDLSFSTTSKRNGVGRVITVHCRFCGNILNMFPGSRLHQPKRVQLHQPADLSRCLPAVTIDKLW